MARAKIKITEKLQINDKTLVIVTEKFKGCWNDNMYDCKVGDKI